MAKKLPISFPPPIMSLNITDAATALSVHRSTVWRLVRMGKLGMTSYRRIPVVEIERHLRAEVAS